MTAHKFWRFRVNENNGGDSVVFSNFNLSVAPYTQNLVPLSTQTAEAKQTTFVFAEAQTVGAYSLQATGATAPKSWVVEYSDDGTDWVVVALEYLQRDWLANEARHFVCE